MKFGEKLAGILSNPIQTFKKLDREHYGDFFKYFAVLAVVPAVLQGLLLYFGLKTIIPTDYLGNPIITIIGIYIALWVGVLLGGVWYHIWLLVMGYKGKLEDTYRALIYGLTPSYLFSWIPFVGWLAGIWSAILFIFGTSEYGKIQWWRSLIALIIAALVPMVIAVFIVGLALIGSIL